MNDCKNAELSIVNEIHLTEFAATILECDLNINWFFVDLFNKLIWFAYRIIRNGRKCREN